MLFQSWVYFLERDLTNNIKTTGVYPNFKKAYEQLENLEKGNIIVDCGDEYCAVNFEAIRYTGFGFYTTKYKIRRELLSIFPEDITISCDMIRAIEEENKERKPSKYRVRAEVI